jgi:hypothetical protein
MSLLVKKSRESTTLQLVIMGYLAILIKFVVADLTIAGLDFPGMTATEFGISGAAILAVWLQREWREAKFKVPNG